MSIRSCRSMYVLRRRLGQPHHDMPCLTLEYFPMAGGIGLRLQSIGAEKGLRRTTNYQSPTCVATVQVFAAPLIEMVAANIHGIKTSKSLGLPECQNPVIEPHTCAQFAAQNHTVPPCRNAALPGMLEQPAPPNYHLFGLLPLPRRATGTGERWPTGYVTAFAVG